MLCYKVVFCILLIPVTHPFFPSKHNYHFTKLYTANSEKSKYFISGGKKENNTNIIYEHNPKIYRNKYKK
jgi:hypothetical protein